MQNMIWELEQSTRGQRSGVGYGVDYIDTSTKSTFPPYLQEIFYGRGTVKKFKAAVKRGKGVVFDRIALEAIDRLENGYSNEHGYVYPDQRFISLVKTGVPF